MTKLSALGSRKKHPFTIILHRLLSLELSFVSLTLTLTSFKSLITPSIYPYLCLFTLTSAWITLFLDVFQRRKDNVFFYGNIPIILPKLFILNFGNVSSTKVIVLHGVSKWKLKINIIYLLTSCLHIETKYTNLSEITLYCTKDSHEFNNMSVIASSKSVEKFVSPPSVGMKADLRMRRPLLSGSRNSFH